MAAPARSGIQRERSASVLSRLTEGSCSRENTPAGTRDGLARRPLRRKTNIACFGTAPITIDARQGYQGLLVEPSGFWADEWLRGTPYNWQLLFPPRDYKCDAGQQACELRLAARVRFRKHPFRVKSHGLDRDCALGCDFREHFPGRDADCDVRLRAC